MNMYSAEMKITVHLHAQYLLQCHARSDGACSASTALGATETQSKETVTAYTDH